MNYRTYKRKLDLTKAQEQTLRSWIGACRVVYNLGLEVKIEAYKKCRKSIHRFELDSQIKGLRRDVAWIESVPSISLSNCIKRLDFSYKRFFNGHGFPKFANKKTYKSIEFNQNTKVLNNKIKVPKIGWLKIFKDSPIIGDIKNIIIKIEPTGLFACIQCENVPAKFTSENNSIGLDMGISNFCIDSNGSIIDNPRHFKRYERKLRIENRSLARKKKFSKSWYKQSKRLSLLHHKIGNIRKDFLHKQSTLIAKANNIVYMENLNVKGMGKNKSLSKHILDAGWGMFRTMLEYSRN